MSMVFLKKLLPLGQGVIILVSVVGAFFGFALEETVELILVQIDGAETLAGFFIDCVVGTAFAKHDGSSFRFVSLIVV